MADIEVTCISKPTKMAPHEQITHLGGEKWKWTRARVIASIDSRTNTFYVRDTFDETRMELRVVRPSGQPPYVRAWLDGKFTDNLLYMPDCECPVE